MFQSHECVHTKCCIFRTRYHSSNNSFWCSFELFLIFLHPYTHGVSGIPPSLMCPYTLDLLHTWHVLHGGVRPRPDLQVTVAQLQHAHHLRLASSLPRRCCAGLDAKKRMLGEGPSSPTTLSTGEDVFFQCFSTHHACACSVRPVPATPHPATVPGGES